jgi:hypothetical protein
VNSIEDRLQDAFRADAETVRPGTLRGLPERHPRPGPRRRGAWRQAVIPLAAAAAVAVVVLGATVLVPRLFPGRNGVTTSAGPPPFYLGEGNGSALDVNNATTGKVVAQVPGPRKGATVWIATGTGRLTFLVAFISQQAQAKCNGRLWLYRLRLTPAGRPLAMSLAATTTVHGLLGAMSQGGQVLATVPNGCSGNPPTGITVLNRITHQTRHWLVAPGSLLDPSLSSNGSLLAYATTNGIAVQPTGVAGGSLLSRGRTVARAGEFGPGTTARYPRLVPNDAVYFATYRGGNGWQLRAYSLATGTTRLVTDLPGKPLGIVSDTSGRYLLLRYDTGTARSRHGRGRAVYLGRLDTATGKITSLAAHATGIDQFVGEAVLAW